MFKIKIKKKAENFQSMGIISTMEKMKKRNFGEHKQVYVKSGRNYCYFFIS